LEEIWRQNLPDRTGLTADCTRLDISTGSYIDIWKKYTTAGTQGHDGNDGNRN
jgi:hypothetical protein